MSNDQRRNRVFNLLKSHTLTITEIYSELKEEFPKDRKSFVRDIEKLLKMGWVVEDEGSGPTAYYANPNFKRDYNLRFSDEDLQVLSLGLDTLKQLAPRAISQVGSRIYNTISEALPDEMARHLNLYRDRYFNCYTYAGKSLASNDKDILEVFRSLREQKRIKCTYGSKERELSPTIVKMAAGEPYLFAKDHGDDKTKCFKLSRMSEVEVLKTPKELDDGVELAKWKYHFGGYGAPDIKNIEYRLIGDSTLARVFSEKQIAPEQEVTELPDGRFELKFTQTSSLELISIIASLGGLIDEIHPQEVKEQVIEIWQKGLERLT